MNELGTRSNCHPLTGLNPNWFAVRAWDHVKEGISLVLRIYAQFIGVEQGRGPIIFTAMHLDRLRGFLDVLPRSRGQLGKSANAP
jgi:hypothetical protein